VGRKRFVRQASKRCWPVAGCSSERHSNGPGGSKPKAAKRIDRITAKLGLVSERDLAAAYTELIGSPIRRNGGIPGRARRSRSHPAGVSEADA
jgi:hypothetical protein